MRSLPIATVLIAAAPPALQLVVATARASHHSGNSTSFASQRQRHELRIATTTPTLHHSGNSNSRLRSGNNKLCRGGSSNTKLCRGNSTF